MRVRKRGFTLIEALVALGLLLGGVYAVLRIFPLGLGTVGYARNVQVATRLAEQEVERLLAKPANLPSRIVATDGAGTVLPYDPNDLIYAAAPYSAGQASVSNGSDAVTGSGTQWLAAVGSVLPGCFFRVSGSSDWYVVTTVQDDTHLTLDHPYAGSSGTVNYRVERPSWEPDAIFLPRTIVGETIEVPRQPPAGGAFQVPKHILAFGPILPMGSAPAVVYSTRYYPVDAPGLLATGEDHFQYVIDDSTGVLTFDSVPYARSFKVDYSWVNKGAASPSTQSTLNELFTLPANQTTYTLAQIQGPSQQVVADSERIYRTFTYNPSGTPGRGEFSMTQVGRLLGVVQFSPDDALNTVMIDYRVSDWQITHEDKQVGADGVVRLAVAPLRSAAYRSPPRESQAFYVDWPNQHDIVAVDLDSGDALYGDSTVQAFGTPDAAGYVGTFLVNYKGGLLQLSQGAVNRSGRTYRIYYRTVEDWGVRVAKAADHYYEAATPGASTDQTYTRSNATLTFPTSERGKSVVVDYTYQPSGAAASDPYRRVTGELHTIPTTGQTNPGVIQLDLPSGATVKGVGQVAGASLAATAVWANDRRRSTSKENISVGQKIVARRVETFAALNR